jgi:hypothetical protein
VSTTERLITGHGWQDGFPVLRSRLDRGRGADRTIALHPEREPLSLAVGARHCIGYREGRQRMACPHSADLSDRSGKQCATCQQRDTFRPCLICDGFRCPKLVPSAYRSCTQTHHLYLASFGGPEVKVGTASHPRRDARLVDQGPLYAIRVARGEGPRIKQLEHIASTRTLAVEGMRRSRKLALLRGAVEDTDVQAAVLDVLSDLRSVCGAAYGGVYDDLFVPPEVVVLPPFARETRAALAHESELPVEEGRRIEGRIVGAVGHVAVLEEPAGRVLLDLGDLVGRRVTLNPGPDVRRSSVQLGLF